MGAAVPLSVARELGFHLTQCHLAEVYLCTKWYPDPSSRLATVDMGLKVGNAVPLSMEGVGSPSNTMRPRPRPTSVASGILIHPTVWAQYTNVADRQDNGPMA